MPKCLFPKCLLKCKGHVGPKLIYPGKIVVSHLGAGIVRRRHME